MTGSIRTGDYTDKDGKKRYTFDVWANNVEFCESKKESTPAAKQNKAPATKKPDIEYMAAPDDEGLPF